MSELTYTDGYRAGLEAGKKIADADAAARVETEFQSQLFSDTLDKKQLEDIARIVNCAEFPSLRVYFVRQAIAFYAQGSADQALARLGNLLKGMVIDMERMRDLQTEAAHISDPYDV